jgi:hypothetical protein
MKHIKSILFIPLLLISQAIWAHVGSPGVVFQGNAGPYAIMVNVNPPDVIPGTATTSVYIDGKQVSHIYVQPIYWMSGDKGSPAADEAFPVKGTPGQYQCQLWLMEIGVASMRVTVEGPEGKGSVIVPVMALATAQRKMSASLDWALGSLGLLLVVLMATIIGACISDGLVAPGMAITSTFKRKRISGMIMTVLVLGLVLYGGSLWWNYCSKLYNTHLYKPPLVHTSILTHGDQMIFKLTIDPAWSKKNGNPMNYIVPDHGKLMHLFLIKEHTLDAFAHLHPLRPDSMNYIAALPDLPEGRYLVFGDIVRWNGFTETLADTVDIPAKTIMHQASNKTESILSKDPDDAYMLSNAIIPVKNPYTGKPALICGLPGTVVSLGDSLTVTWEHQANSPLEANKVYPLTFAMHNLSGKAVKLEPYMGMKGHAVVMKYDGSVYVHLHPVGSYSMVSQQIIQGRISGNEQTPHLPDASRFRDSIDRLIVSIKSMSEEQRNVYLGAGMKEMRMTNMGEHADGMVTFPYAFPVPGKYRIWVQMKLNGKILNSAFDASVD